VFGANISGSYYWGSVSFCWWASEVFIGVKLVGSEVLLFCFWLVLYFYIFLFFFRFRFCIDWRLYKM